MTQLAKGAARYADIKEMTFERALKELESPGEAGT